MWTVYKPSDFIEGRYPNVPDKTFHSEEEALEYMKSQHGIMGRKMKPEKMGKQLWCNDHYAIKVEITE